LAGLLRYVPIAAHHDVGCLLGGVVEIRADAVGGRSHLLDHFLEFLDHLARFADGLFLRLDLRTHHVELAPMPVLGRNGGDEKVKSFEQTQLLPARFILGNRIALSVLVLHPRRLYGRRSLAANGAVSLLTGDAMILSS
jgi:hypothetical protein